MNIKNKNSNLKEKKTILKLVDQNQDTKKKGIEYIKNFVKNLPHKPGVYRMYDKSETLLYVGKAKDLKNRISNYTRIGAHNRRILRMINETNHMEFIVTKSEIEALLLEANLIKQRNPRYNILLKDDKSLPYIFIRDHYRSPAISKHRGPRIKKGKYFGPFATPSAVNETISIIQKIFLLRNCEDSFFENRKRPCLLYQMKRCAAPCTHEILDEKYQNLVSQAQGFLEGKNTNIMKQLEESMHKASSKMEYEQAVIYRDRIRSLQKIYHQQTIHLTQTQEADIFSLARQNEMNCIQVFFYRYKQNWGNKSYFFKTDPDLADGEILQDFIMQFYADKPVPKQILISSEIPEHELIFQALQTKTEKKIDLIFPKKGEKKAILENALLNAKEALARKLADSETQQKIFKKFADLFNLKKTSSRIEIYDNSHLMGENAIGAMVVATPNGFIKNQYRKFNIKSQNITAGDDYGMMREVIRRRFLRLLNENQEKKFSQDLSKDPLPQWPDVLLIDGGKGQLNAVIQVLNELGISKKIDVIAIAKGPDRNAGRERFFMPNKEEFQLPPQNEILYFVQKLRDEAHRFAIGVHRSKRQKKLLNNPLNEIPGVGLARKRALLAHFGSAKTIKNSTVQDLIKVKGISKKLAEKILSLLNS